jgi:hypothetical protein
LVSASSFSPTTSSKRPEARRKSTAATDEWLLPASLTETTDAASRTGGSLKRNSLPSEKIAVLTPMPRPSDSSALTTSAGLRLSPRSAYTVSRQRFSKKLKRQRSNACSLIAAAFPNGIGF